MKQNGILKILENLKENVRQQYKAEITGVFGSYIKGGAKKSQRY